MIIYLSRVQMVKIHTVPPCGFTHARQKEKTSVHLLKTSALPDIGDKSVSSSLTAQGRYSFCKATPFHQPGAL